MCAGLPARQNASGETWLATWLGSKSELYFASAEIKGPMTLDLSRWDDPAHTRRALLDLRRDGDRFILEGTFEGKKVRARLAKREPATLLMTRGFHWINEVPFNR
jgi:hypothetical protein